MNRLSVVVLVAGSLTALGWIIMATQSGAPKADAQTDSDRGVKQADGDEPTNEELVAQLRARGENRDQFAGDRNPPPRQVSPAPFDGEKAMQYLRELCDIGPRISGTDGMKKQQDYLKKHFEEQGAKVQFQQFKAQQKSKGRDEVEMANMIISFWPERPRRMIICSHYDTRPIADQEPDMGKWREPFVSANDGGSGVAFLMELARHIKELNIAVGVDFVLFDGEEYIWDPQIDKFFFGSEHFAQRAKLAKTKYIGAILLDMIGGKDARFPKEPNSMFHAGPLVESVWKVAAEQKCNVFVFQQSATAVEDDHIALNRAGIPAIDLIDFSYKHWHRLSDTPANCSAEPMEQVSKVLSVWLQRVK